VGVGFWSVCLILADARSDIERPDYCRGKEPMVLKVVPSQRPYQNQLLEQSRFLALLIPTVVI
jgi:hypothetical protein